VTILPEHTELDEATTEIEGDTLDVTVSVVFKDEAVVPVKHVGNAPPAVNIAFTISPLEGTKLKVAPVDWDTLFLNQVYTGAVPVLTPVAVKVTPAPEHTEVEDAETFTMESTVPVTDNVIPVEVAEVLDKQVGNVPPAAKTAFTISPLEGT